MLGQIGMPPAEMPTGVLADYLMTLDHIEGLANGTQLRASVGQTLRTRLVYEGTRLDISDSSKAPWRSEEHTSELQSLMRISYAVFCLKKKKRDNRTHTVNTNNTNT